MPLQQQTSHAAELIPGRVSSKLGECFQCGHDGQGVKLDIAHL